MSGESKTGRGTQRPEDPPPAKTPEGMDHLVAPARKSVMLMPGVAAIGIYMLVLAATVVVGVASGRVRPLYLVFSALFIAASFGLVLFLRWAWALALAAVLLLLSLFFYRFSVHHEPASLVQGLLNLVFFLYLVRTEVRSKLR
jgi:hypothetical protein